MLTGGCHCGHVRYQAAGSPRNETVCHCSLCRRTSGAPFVAWFSVRRSDFQFVRGAATLYMSSARATRTFCPRCGTQLTFQHLDFPEEIDVTTCSLDEPERVPPKDHIHISSKLGWIELADRLPRFTQARP